MATKGLVRWWRGGERLLIEVAGNNVEARWLKFEEQLVTLQSGRRCLDAFTQEQSGAGAPTVETISRHERAGLYDEDPLLDECLW